MDSSETDAARGHTLRRFRDGEHTYAHWQDDLVQAGHSHQCPTYVHRTPPCQGSCPSGEDIRGWLQVLRGVEKPPAGTSLHEYAFRRVTDANPFPAVMGRVCPAPCEDGCNRNQVDDFVGINAVEQFIGDHALAAAYAPPAVAAESGRRVAIVGGGPAGLSAAWQLRRRGHACTVFDDHDQLGGMMRYGIPGYRTPREVLDAEIARILALGIEVRTATRIGRDLGIVDLERDFDAILWAPGTQHGRALPIPGWDAENCITGVAFLRAFNEGRLQFVSRRVVVVGGGDTSIDVASVARRLGRITEIHAKDRPERVILGFTAHDVSSALARDAARVTLTSLFAVDEMTAAAREVADARREGVEILGGVMPLEVVKNAAGYATALRLCRCDLQGDRPVPRPGTEFLLEADLFVAAIGQCGDFSGGLESLDSGTGFMRADRHFRMVGRDRHFVAGDIVRPHLLTTAIGQGAVAAESINHYLNGRECPVRPRVDAHRFDLLAKLREVALEPQPYDHRETCGTSTAAYAVHNYEDRSAVQIVASDKLFLGHFAPVARQRRVVIGPDQDTVLGHFATRLLGLDAEQALAEAGRCMSCGMCFECNNCVIYCPQDAVFRVPAAHATTGRYVDTDYARCTGCRICADVCPSGYIDMGLGE